MLENITFTIAVVRDLLNNLKENSTAGPDTFTPKVLEEYRETQSLPIFVIMKMSFDSGIALQHLGYARLLVTMQSNLVIFGLTKVTFRVLP